MHRRCLLPILCQLALLGSALAITSRDDVTDAAAQTLAIDSAYASVGKFTRSDSDITSGVLIDAYYVLTAAHIIQGNPASAFTFTIGGFDYASASYVLSGTDDLAIFQLTLPVLNVTPALLYTGSAELGKTATLVGFGLGGNGSTGGTGIRGTKRGATNVIDFANGVQLAYDFDSGLPTDNQFGTFLQTTNEGLIAIGDSGGGTFASFSGQPYLIGIHSGVAPDADAFSYDYGEVGVDVRLSAPSAQAFIQSVVPEPGSAVLLTAGLGLLLARRRR